MDEVPLEDDEQAAVYWQLLCWAKRSELFTRESARSRPRAPLPRHRPRV